MPRLRQESALVAEDNALFWSIWSDETSQMNRSGQAWGWPADSVCFPSSSVQRA